MRVLCLHGMGTNSGIFETQTEMFRSLLPSDFSYEFFDAEHEIAAAEGVGEIFPGPYTCWYSCPTIPKVKNAHEFVWDVIEEEGPFDAIMGFSQGAALAASVLLHHQIEHPDEPCPFKLAIFICGSLPYSVDDLRGVDVARLFTEPSKTGFGPPNYIQYEPSKDDGSATARPLIERERPRPTPLQNTKPNSPPQDPDIIECARRIKLASINNDSWGDMPSSSEVPDTPSESDSDMDSIAPTPLFSPSQSSGESTPLTSGYTSEEDENFQFQDKQDTEGVHEHTVRRFHPDVEKTRIAIPTVNIYGKRDPYHKQSIGLSKFCDASWTSCYEHAEGHNVPRDSKSNEAIAAAISKAVSDVEVCAY